MRFIHLIIIIILLTTIGFLFADDNESLPIHPFLQNIDYCMPCHNSSKEKRLLQDTSLACSQCCLSCHNPANIHHPINIKISERLPDNFLLTPKKRLTCITCHNLNHDRFDSSSWKSESLYENMFKGSSKYKTYFLVQKNNNGQLCKTCH